jgi:hypothetical protein
MLSPCGHAVRHLVLSTLGALVFISGCAGAGADTRHRLDDLEQQLISAQNRNDRLEERVAALEAALDAEHDQEPPEGEAPPAAQEHGPSLPIVKLGPNADETVDGDPEPDVLESESDNRLSGGQTAGSPSDRGQGAPNKTKQGAPNKTKQGAPNQAGKKNAAPGADKPREVIKLHGDGSQSRLSAPAPGASSEVQSPCPV